MSAFLDSIMLLDWPVLAAGLAVAAAATIGERGENVSAVTLWPASADGTSQVVPPSSDRSMRISPV